MTPSRWLLLTCGTALALLAAIAALAVHVIEAPNFPSLTTDIFARGYDYAFLRHGEHCEILIYGDSTAITGYDPRELSRQTGLSACNISQALAIVEQTGTLPLDAFLEHNRAPKFLVFQLTPEGFFRDPDWDHLPELSPVAEMLRHDRGLHTDLTLLGHAPHTATYFGSALMQRFFPDKEKFPAFYRQFSDALELQASIGYLTMPLPPDDHCKDRFSKPLPPTPDLKWVESLRSRYQAKGMTVLVDVSPVKSCAPRMDFYLRSMGDLPDNRLVGYPNRMFNDFGRHFTPEGSKLATDALADQINQLQHAKQPN
jgi:hypothetical protein